MFERGGPRSTGCEDMKDETRRLDIIRIMRTGPVKKSDLVVRETPVTIFLNDVDLVTLLCSPKDLEYLAVGFLFAEGLIKGKEDIKGIFADKKDGAVWVETVGGRKPHDNILTRRLITSGCGKGMSFIDSPKHRKSTKGTRDFEVDVSQVEQLMKEFQARSQIYRMTGGVHGAGLANAHGIVAFNEDIGRHNAVDKIIGESVLKGIKTDELMMMTSGRISSDLLVKAARARIPVIVSRSAPTDLAVRLARDLGITIVGFARGSRMNVYSNEWRITAKSRAKLRGKRLQDLAPEKKTEVKRPR